MFDSKIFLRQVTAFHSKMAGWETYIRLSMMGKYWFSPMRSFNMSLGQAKELRRQLDEQIKDLEGQRG